MTENLEEAALNFLKAVAYEYGQEESYRLYNLIGTEVSEDLGKRLLYAMLAGDYEPPAYVILTGIGTANFIEVIKMIRRYTGVGLKDAKTLGDQVHHGGKQVKLACNTAQEAREFKATLKGIGACVKD